MTRLKSKKITDRQINSCERWYQYMLSDAEHSLDRAYRVMNDENLFAFLSDKIPDIANALNVIAKTAHELDECKVLVHEGLSGISYEYPEITEETDFEDLLNAGMCSCRLYNILCRNGFIDWGIDKTVKRVLMNDPSEVRSARSMGSATWSELLKILHRVDPYWGLPSAT